MVRRQQLRTKNIGCRWMKEVVFEVDVAGEGAGIGVTSSTPPGKGEAVSYTHLTLPTNREV